MNAAILCNKWAVFSLLCFCWNSTLHAAALASPSQKHWSLQPIKRPAIPDAGASWARNPIDHFVAARLAVANLTPSPEADGATLIRRIYFDLTGLPPTPEEMDSFSRNGSSAEFERTAKAMLASPRYGECWARHWLDIVRYSETHGFEMNQPRPNAWPYRDYVIKAFQADKPYDQFVMEQLAGDALGADEATEFLVAGPWDQVKSPDEVLTKNQRADELHDMVATTGSTFLGLTIGCARCHNHKFDPIPQTDYYAIKAVFEGVQHGDRPLHRKDDESRKQQIARLKEELVPLVASLEALEPIASTVTNSSRVRVPVSPSLNVERLAATEAKFIRFTILETTGSEPCIDELEVFANGTNVASAAYGAKATASGTYRGSDFHKLEHINDGKYGNERSWISNEGGKGWVQIEFPNVEWIERVLWSRDRSLNPKFTDRVATKYRIEASLNGVDWRLLAGDFDRLSAGEELKPLNSDVFGLSREQNMKRLVLASKKRALEKEIEKLSLAPQVYAGNFKTPEPTHRFQRGDPMQPREIIAPGVLSKVSVDGAVVDLSTNTPDKDRRLALGKWIVSTNNPLTARVIVNRLWQYHFGEGLVSTPSDFGANGTRPSNPELLDWLASELMNPAQGKAWSLAHIQELIVTSATYRQSSAGRPECLARDAGTRLLWRFPPRRLDAEAIRDGILAVTGKLDMRMGGPGWSPFEPNDNYVRVYKPKQTFGPDDFRRMVYASGVRQRPDGVFGSFDCPDGGQIAPKRSRSTTPLQALNLLNSVFMSQAAGFFADRLEHEQWNKTEDRVDRAFSLAFGRQPSPEELRASTLFIQENDLKLFCRTLLNANEFIYIF
jgi:hypothetical protein